MSPLNIIFAGTPEFAVPCLQALINSGHSLCGVYTQPDRPAGRGRKLTASPVKQLALQFHLSVFQPVSLREETIQQSLRNLQADLMIVVAYGLILPLPILTIPRLGCINVHASLLPRWRGAAPIQRAIQAGDTVTGITLMQMDQGLDTGAILYQQPCPIQPKDTAQTLHDRLAALGATSLLTTLELIQTNALKAIQQDDKQACYAKKLEKSEANINWEQDAISLDRMIRAFNPWPVAQTNLNDLTVRILQAEAQSTSTVEKPGTLLRVDKNGIDVATGNGILRLLQLQMPGGKALTVADLLNAKRDLFVAGHCFENHVI